MSACDQIGHLLACACKEFEMRVCREPEVSSRPRAARLQDLVELSGLDCKPATCQFELIHFLKICITVMNGNIGEAHLKAHGRAPVGF